MINPDISDNEDDKASAASNNNDLTSSTAPILLRTDESNPWSIANKLTAIIALVMVLGLCYKVYKDYDKETHIDELKMELNVQRARLDELSKQISCPNIQEEPSKEQRAKRNEFTLILKSYKSIGGEMTHDYYIKRACNRFNNEDYIATLQDLEKAIQIERNSYIAWNNRKYIEID